MVVGLVVGSNEAERKDEMKTKITHTLKEYKCCVFDLTSTSI